jgi:predicted dehydrogenase
MRRVRAAILGCGKVGRLHARALASLDNCELVAACDADRARAESFGVPAFTDPLKMFRDAGVEAITVCTPHPLHVEAVEAAASVGVHVLVEKPMAASVADCDRMLAAARAVKLAVISQRRWYEPVLRMKAAIDAGKIGRPVLGTVVMLSWRDEAYYRSDSWRGKWSTEGGGVLVNQAPHQLDILQWLMGEIEEVRSFWGNLNHPYIEVEDTAVAAIRFRGGGLGSIVASVSQKPGIYTKVHIHGSNGASVGVQTDSGATFIAGLSGVQDAAYNDLWTIAGEEHLREPFEAADRARFAAVDPTIYYHACQMRDFFDAIVHDRAPAVTGEDGRKVVSLIETIYRGGRPNG